MRATTINDPSGAWVFDEYPDRAEGNDRDIFHLAADPSVKGSVSHSKNDGLFRVILHTSGFSMAYGAGGTFELALLNAAKDAVETRREFLRIARALVAVGIDPFKGHGAETPLIDSPSCELAAMQDERLPPSVPDPDGAVEIEDPAGPACPHP